MSLSFLPNQKLESVHGDLKIFLKDTIEDAVNHILLSFLKGWWEKLLFGAMKNGTSKQLVCFCVTHAWAPMKVPFLWLMSSKLNWKPTVSKEAESQCVTWCTNIIPDFLLFFLLLLLDFLILLFQKLWVVLYLFSEAVLNPFEQDRIFLKRQGWVWRVLFPCSSYTIISLCELRQITLHFLCLFPHM